MLFSDNKRIFESEKERNLYTKFFAGYFLNELVEGYKTRVEFLNKYLSKLCGQKIDFKNPCTSFDNHAYLINSDSDKGEFADVLLHDPIQQLFVSFEIKYLSNWNANDDLEKNLKRIELIKEKHPKYSILFFLLVSKVKWSAVKRMANRSGSNYQKYINNYADKVNIIFWEDLVGGCADQRVKDYMKERLKLVNAPHNQRMVTKE